MRKLASIQRITAITPIDGADKIERATILGWTCVVKKNEFAVGQLVIYIEVDSMLPKCIWSGFLWRDGDTKDKYRLRTVRLKGVTSQGLVLPVSVLGDGMLYHENLFEGRDVTDDLCIEKYEPPPLPACLQGVAKGNFPDFIPKTDETRIQAEPWILQKMQGKKIYISEKVDGSSCTMFLKDNYFSVCSRNLELTETVGNTQWKVARYYKIEENLRQLGKNLALQGELVGEGIQCNKYKIIGHDFLCFNIYDIDAKRYLSINDFIETCRILSVPTVPILSIYDILTNTDVNYWIELSKGKSVKNLNTEREGIVVRAVEEEYIDGYGRFSFKSINPTFLLKNND